MRLGVNGWRMQGKRTGVGRYLENLVTRWSSELVAGRFDEINFYTPTPLQNGILPDAVRERVLGPSWRMLIWENLRFGPVASEDVLFCPSYSRPFVARGRVVVTTHDATLKLFPELAGGLAQRAIYNPLYGWSARAADLVITSTEAATDDIARAWNVPREKMRVVNLAIADIFKPIRDDDPRLAEIAPRFLDARVPYFLFVGKMSGRRNLPLLMKAFAEFKRSAGLPHKLLVVGLKLERLGIDALLAELGIADDVRQSGYVSDEDLNLIYNAAQGFIMPSTYETLSFPVMESQAVGTPVITVDTAGSREVTGGAALFIPKMEIAELVGAMTKLASDEALRRELSDKGLKNARRYSWDRCAAETLAVLEEAARS